MTWLRIFLYENKCNIASYTKWCNIAEEDPYARINRKMKENNRSKMETGLLRMVN